METRPFTPKLPEVPECEQMPLVRSLLQTIAELQEQNQRLTDEIRRSRGTCRIRVKSYHKDSDAGRGSSFSNFGSKGSGTSSMSRTY